MRQLIQLLNILKIKDRRFICTAEDCAFFSLRRYKSKNGVAIIIKADYDKLIKLAYLKSSGRSNPSYFMTLPKGHPLINEFNSIAFRP